MGDDDVLMASNNAAAASQARREFKVKRSVSHEHLRDVGRDLSRESSEEAEGSDVMGLQLPGVFFQPHVVHAVVHSDLLL